MKFIVQHYRNGVWYPLEDATLESPHFTGFGSLQSALETAQLYPCARVLDQTGRVILREAGVWRWSPSPNMYIWLPDWERYMRFKNQKVSDVLPYFYPLAQVPKDIEFEIWQLL